MPIHRSFGLFTKAKIAPLCVNRWHERMGHPRGLAMRQIIFNTKGHELQASSFLKDMKSNRNCYMSSQLYFRGFKGCGPINPPCGLLRIFLNWGLIHMFLF